MKIGLLGGTFDPPHRGHLHLAQMADHALGLHRILFIPCKRQPLKESRPAASDGHRCAMLSLALRKHPDWLLSTMELDRAGRITTTWRTVQALRADYPSDDLYLLVGADGLENFHKWRRWREILSHVSLVAAPRQPDHLPRIPKPLSGFDVSILEAPPRPAASSEIRTRLGRGEPVDQWLTKPVRRYIRKHSLYEEQKEER